MVLTYLSLSRTRGVTKSISYWLLEARKIVSSNSPTRSKTLKNCRLMLWVWLPITSHQEHLCFPHPHLQPSGDSDEFMCCFALYAELDFSFSVLFWCIILSMIPDALSKCPVRMQSIFAILEINSLYVEYLILPSPSIPILIAKISKSLGFISHKNILYDSYQKAKKLIEAVEYKVLILNAKIQGRYLCRKVILRTR